ncbi:MAG: SCO family protein [Bacteroidetes bacterium]|nr:SCO family protein [Bacteroidota bacterium]
MKIVISLLFSLILFASCKENKKQETTLPSNSIFNLTSNWKNQNGDSLQLHNLQGKTLVVVMIYTSCKLACPILVAKMKTIESKISRKDIDKVSLVLVTIDPKTDSSARLKEFAKTNNMDAPQWVFLTSNEEATQEFANVLAMKYKKISPVDFSHSNIISVFSPNGQLVSQEEGAIEVDNVVSTVHKTVKESK